MIENNDTECKFDEKMEYIFTHEQRIKELKQWIQRLKDEVEESNKKIAYNIPEIKRLEKILGEIQ